MKNELIYPKLSYEMVGLLYRVYNELGYGLQEKQYKKAIEIELKKDGYKYKKELLTRLKYNGENIGKYYLDFLIADKIVLELKVGRYFHKKDFLQINSYLISNKVKLGLLILFSPDKVQIKRVLNSKFISKD